MLNVYIVVSAALAVIFILLGFLVATRNINSYSNRLYLIFSTFIAGWLVTNYIGGASTYSETVALIANKLVFFFGILTVTSLLFFIKSLIGRKTTTFWKLVLAFNIAFAFFGLSPWIVSGVQLKDDIYAISFGMLSTGYFLLLLFDVLAVVVIALNGMRHAQGQLKSQLKTILISLAITLGGVVLANALIPFIFDYYGLSNSGAFLTAVLVFGIAYSIVKHKLFDIRPFVARSAAYLLLVGSLATILAGSLFALTSLFFKDQNLSIGVKVGYIFVALIMALILQPLKRFFDNVTNSVFYRDSYDSQELLNNLNRSLVTTIDLDELLTRSSKLISDTLKVEYCIFAIHDSQNHSLDLTGSPMMHFDQEVVQNITTASNHISGKGIVADELETGRQHLKELMQDANLAMIMKLQGKVKGQVQHPGYILLGQKKSGGLYSSQDTQILEIIADELVIAIQNALRFKEIEQFNITLRQKIEAATKELRKTNAKLKALDEAKDEFISMASHQLRTPLTSIKGYLSMILDGDAGAVKPKQKEMIQQSFNGAQRMVYLIADLLNVSRLQTGKFVIENQPANLAEMVVGEMAQLKEQAEAKQIEMTYNKPDKFPTMNLDETKIRQVIMNFLDNALYYTANKGKVEVKVEESTDSVSFTVTDTGVGVPKSVQHNLFGKFYRADNARKMRPDGTGLGLFMAKKVIVAEGGAIIFNSVEGKGSTFGFTLPRHALEVKDGGRPPADQQKPAPPKPETVAAAK